MFSCNWCCCLGVGGTYFRSLSRVLNIGISTHTRLRYQCFCILQVFFSFLIACVYLVSCSHRSRVRVPPWKKVPSPQSWTTWERSWLTARRKGNSWNPSWLRPTAVCPSSVGKVVDEWWDSVHWRWISNEKPSKYAADGSLCLIIKINN